MQTTGRFKVAFPIPEDLKDEVLDLAARIRETETGRNVHADELVDLVDRVAQHGLGFFFLHPIELAGLGALARKTVDVALHTGRKAVIGVARRIVRGMSDEEMGSIVDFVEGIVFEFDEQEGD